MLLPRVITRSSISKIPALAIGFAVLYLSIQYGHAAPAGHEPESLEAGFHEMYSLDFRAAHKTFESWQELHPEDPLGPAANAAAYLFAEFERLHILELDLFTDKKRFEGRDRIAPDPATKIAFESELAKADAIAGKILAESAGDCNALFAKSFTDGLRGNYLALVQKENGDALNFLKSSRVMAEKLLSIDPTYDDAYLAIGIENYLLGIRSTATRWMLRLTGAQTNKDKGLASLKITAEKGRYLAPYARLLLAVAALRDRDRKTAQKLLGDLAREFPQNHLYQVELERLRKS
jgi:hypothetical protein